MKTMHHENLIAFYEVFETVTDFKIVMECCRGGELFDRIQAAGKFSEKDASLILKQIMLGINHMHSQSVAHCDLKPDNFLFKDESFDCLKIIDFGMSKHLHRFDFMTSFRGTPYYVAPEVLKHDYTMHADIWSFGVVAFVMLFGYPPFHGKDDNAIFSKIKQGFDPNVRAGYGAWFPDKIPCSPVFKDFLARCLTSDVAARMTAAEVLEHPWLNGSADENPMIELVAANLTTFLGTSKLKVGVLDLLVDSMTDHEIDQLKLLFKEADVDGDGSISVQELVDVFKKNGADNEDFLQKAKAVIANADIDGDGSISYEELLRSAVNRKLNSKEERLWRVFCMFDKDRDGAITTAEISEVLKVSPSEAAKLLAEVDKNGDRTIDYEEFLTMMSNKDEINEAF